MAPSGCSAAARRADTSGYARRRSANSTNRAPTCAGPIKAPAPIAVRCDVQARSKSLGKCAAIAPLANQLAAKITARSNKDSKKIPAGVGNPQKMRGFAWTKMAKVQLRMLVRSSRMIRCTASRAPGDLSKMAKVELRSRIKLSLAPTIASARSRLVLQLQHFFLHCAAGDEAVGEDLVGLSDTVGAVDGLRFDRRVPPKSSRK
jgi:hypothetical protein